MGGSLRSKIEGSGQADWGLTIKSYPEDDLAIVNTHPQMVRIETSCRACGVTAHWTGVDLPGHTDLTCAEQPEGLVCSHWHQHNQVTAVALSLGSAATVWPVDARLEVCGN